MEMQWDAQLAFYSIVLNWTFDHNSEDTEPFEKKSNPNPHSNPNSNLTNRPIPNPKDESDSKSNALNNHSALGQDDISVGPAHKKRKLNNGTVIASPQQPPNSTALPPPPLEQLDASSPSTKLSQIHITSPRKRARKQHLKIPKLSNQEGDDKPIGEKQNIEVINLIEKSKSPTPKSMDSKGSNPLNPLNPLNHSLKTDTNGIETATSNLSHSEDAQKRKRFKRAVTLKSNKAKSSVFKYSINTAVV